MNSTIIYRCFDCWSRNPSIRDDQQLKSSIEVVVMDISLITIQNLFFKQIKDLTTKTCIDLGDKR